MRYFLANFFIKIIIKNTECDSQFYIWKQIRVSLITEMLVIFPKTIWVIKILKSLTNFHITCKNNYFSKPKIFYFRSYKNISKNVVP